MKNDDGDDNDDEFDTNIMLTRHACDDDTQHDQDIKIASTERLTHNKHDDAPDDRGDA